VNGRSREVARRALARGVVVGAFLVAAIGALWAVDRGELFNWRHLAWDDQGLFFADKMFPQSAGILYFLVGMVAAPIGFVEEWAQGQARGARRHVVSFSVLVPVVIFLTAVIVVQGLYLGEVFNGEMSFRRGMKYLPEKLQLVADNVAPISVRGLATVGVLMLMSQLRLAEVGKWKAALIGVFVAGGLTLIAFDTVEPDAGPYAFFVGPRFLGDPKLGQTRYELLAMSLAAAEPFLIGLSERLERRAGRWLAKEGSTVRP
jgi:hypothetical protein